MALQPLELDALPRDLFALLAHLFAFARTQGVEEVLEVAITAVLPVELATQTRKPTGLLAQGGIGQGIGEVDMGTGKPFDFQVTRQALEQLQAVRTIGHQQARPADRAERHCCQQFGVVLDARACASVSPAMVEHVFAIGVPFAVAGQRRHQPLSLVMQQVLRLPARMPAKAGTVFQRTEEGMAQKRLILGDQRVPFIRRYFGQAIQTFQRHAIPRR